MISASVFVERVSSFFLFTKYLFFKISQHSISKRDLEIQVIDLYRELPCLWRTQDVDYDNKIKRNAALQELLDVFKTYSSLATIEAVKLKISSMRGSFRKELNKVRFFLTLIFKI